MCCALQAEAKLMSLWRNLGVVFDVRMEGAEIGNKQQAGELNAIRRKVSRFKNLHVMQITGLIVYTRPF